MPTPMSAFADIAARYNIDPHDEEAVDRFFDEQAPSLPEADRAAILAELLASQGEPGQSPARKRYAKGSVDPEISGRLPVQVPLRAVNPTRDAAEMGVVAEALKSCIADFLILSALDVIVDVNTIDEGRIELVLAGPEAQRLNSDDRTLLESIRHLAERVATAQEMIESVDVIVHGSDEFSSLEDTGGVMLSVVKMEDIAVEEMSVMGAAAKLRISNNEFIVFRDEATDQVSVLYKRRNRELGLIS